MSKKRKASTGEETQGSYITLGDGTKVSEILYLNTYTILNNFASLKEGIFGLWALYDIGQKALNPKHEIYVIECQELLKEFLDETGKISDEIAAIVRNLVSISDKRAIFIGKPQGSSLSVLDYNDESYKEKKHKNVKENASLEIEKTETDSEEDYEQDLEKEEDDDVDEVFTGEQDEDEGEEGSTTEITSSQTSSIENPDTTQDETGYVDEEPALDPAPEEDDDVDDVYGSRIQEAEILEIGDRGLSGNLLLFQEEDGA